MRVEQGWEVLGDPWIEVNVCFAFVVLVSNKERGELGVCKRKPAVPLIIL